jgi:two-component system, chemotaxis family, response regulator Rcp1
MATSFLHHVLLIEDNPADVYLIRQAVAECGNIQLWVMRDGPEALTFLRKEFPFTHMPMPALIILDLRLPKADGFELLSAIRRLSAHQLTPLVVLSSMPKERAEYRCLELGADAYVQKATDFDDYFGSVKTLVRRGLWEQSVLGRESNGRLRPR